MRRIQLDKDTRQILAVDYSVDFFNNAVEELYDGVMPQDGQPNVSITDYVFEIDRTFTFNPGGNLTRAEEIDSLLDQPLVKELLELVEQKWPGFFTNLKNKLKVRLGG